MLAIAALSDTLATVTEAGSNNGIAHLLVKALPVVTVITLQFVLHLMMRFSVKSSILGSVANLTSLWRPTHDESQRDKCLLFYKYETLLSSMLHMALAAVSVTVNYTLVSKDETPLASWLSLGLACTCLIITQVYVHCLSDQLYPDNILMKQVVWDGIRKIATATCGVTEENVAADLNVSAANGEGIEMALLSPTQANGENERQRSVEHKKQCSVSSQQASQAERSAF